ncbi:MAG: class I SAM-dependent methyltransferase [Labilithrix sp.]|nr:class I SAM-dependent methyltransferase [Labilithrix sp.]MCW5810719.1 class I SAM-dependent methyltransferase [Labilithrix sp.]
MRDRELEAGAAAHFEDPAYYAQAYARRRDDVVYYRALAEEHGAVLEHGIGNGRIAIPIAQAGVEVVGVDASRPMLADLRARLRREPVAVRRRVTAKHGDLRKVKLGRRFPLVICPFNTALHLYDRADVEQWLARVREHLAPRGELVFDVAMPMPEDLARDPAAPYRIPPFEHPTLGHVRYREHFDYDRVRQVLFVSMVFEPKRGEERMTPLAHRQFFPREMEALLHYNGFDVTALHGDFTHGPLTQRSDVMVFHARPRARHSR